MIPLLKNDIFFPPVTQALRSPNGLLAAGGDLSATRLLEAYRHGIFPWFSEGEPILWWSPDPRMVLFPGEFNLSHSLRKTLRNGRYEVRTDYAFEQVMRACAAPREGANGTWIHEEMITAYCELHRMGYAHSVETWMDGELVGGLYGMALDGTSA
jgi:leucyl/phenylalanyl-tRNA--protein transferase